MIELTQTTNCNSDLAQTIQIRYSPSQIRTGVSGFKGLHP